MYEYCSTNHREGTWDRRQPSREDLDASRLLSLKSFVKGLEGSMEVGECVEERGSVQRSRGRRNSKMDHGIVVLFIFTLWDQFLDAAWYIQCRRSLRYSLSTKLRGSTYD